MASSAARRRSSRRSAARRATSRARCSCTPTRRRRRCARRSRRRTAAGRSRSPTTRSTASRPRRSSRASATSPSSSSRRARRRRAAAAATAAASRPRISRSPRWRRRSSSSRRRCSPPPRTCASSTRRGFATRSASCGASLRRSSATRRRRRRSRVSELPALRAAVLGWYARSRRDLPWRRTTDPYAVLVSEVMLQQTQVARVVPRYVEWLLRWPDVAALAAASRGEVLAAWVGLGYNRRAVALHEAARVVASDGWPADLRSLPGVGPYTAAAVASFCFGAEVAAVDTNVRRVASRLGHGSPEALLAPGRAAEWNQAAMELGATVCTARAPRCEICPVAGWCGSAGRPMVRVRAARRAERFEDSNRWVRGRVVAALAAGEGLPSDIAPERLERAVAGLLQDGLVRRAEGGLALG